MHGLEGARSFVNLDPAHPGPSFVIPDWSGDLAIRTVFEFSNGANGRRDWGAARAGDTGRLH